MTIRRRRNLRGPDGRLRGSTRRRLSRDEVRFVRRSIRDGVLRYEVAELLGVGVRTLYDLIRDQVPELGRGRTGPRPGHAQRQRDEFPELPVEEIYRRAAEIRKAWTPEREREAWSPSFGGPIEG